MNAQQILLAVGACCGTLNACAPSRGAFDPEEEKTMNQEAAQILRTSNDPSELRRFAVLLASSEDRADQQVVLESLTSEGFLLKLNTEDEYRRNPNHLRLRPILRALADNSTPPAKETLVKLTKSAAYLKEGGRIDLLIEATATVRPAPESLIAFWDKYCQPEDGFTPLTIEAMVENGTPPALGLLEKKLLDERHEDDSKQSWMRSSILTHRHQAPLLQSCEALLKSSLSESLKSDLLDALFDYRPQEWYRPAIGFHPPSLADYSANARIQIRSIAKYALEKLSLTSGQRQAIQNMLAQLDRPATTSAPARG